MSASPITPSRRSIETTVASPQGRVSCDSASCSFKQRLSSMTQPSPASTYGETLGSSVPATPLEISNLDPNPSLTQTFHAINGDPAIKSISGSPYSVQEEKGRPLGAHGRVHVKFSDDQASPYRSFVQMSPSSPLKSPRTGRDLVLKNAPVWRGIREAVAGKSAKYHEEDPFISCENAKDDRTTPSSSALACNPGRVGLTPTNDTAQAIFSPQACVFVANLSHSETDEQLEYSVTQAFQQFGNVFVKIRRDSRQMPFAFAQYTNVDDAQRAISQGRGMLVNGRPCRTEVARVNRSLYLSKIKGGGLTEAEARQVMEGQGPIEALWSASATEREMFGLPEGLFIRFAFFDDCRDAIADFRDSDAYRLEQVKGSEESRAAAPRNGAFARSPYRRESFNRPLAPYAVRRDVDARSIFIGNLHPNMSEEQLHAMFQRYGLISHIEIIRKPSALNATMKAFAFVEYERPQSAAGAVQAAPQAYYDLHLRVEHKESMHAGQRSIYGGSSRSILDSDDFLAAFQRGVTIGMNHATQAQLMPAAYYGQYPYYGTFDHPLPDNVAPSAFKDIASPGSQAYQTSYGGAQNSHYQNPSPSTIAGHDLSLQYPSTAPYPYQWPSTGVFGQQEHSEY